jgi:hypothetical protein
VKRSQIYFFFGEKFVYGAYSLFSNIQIFFFLIQIFEIKKMQSHNSRKQNSDNKHDDKWECFRNFVCVHMWDGFVYLFIVVCDSEDDLDYLMDDFSDMRNKILHLHRHGGASEEKYDKTNEIIDKYLRSRFKKDGHMRNEVMISIFRQLESHNIYEPYLTEMIQLFNKMSRFQRKSLREMFLSRIYGYSKFSEYLFKEWNKKRNTMNMKDEDLHQEDKKINVKEQKDDQKIDQNKRKHRKKNRKNEDFHQEDKKIDVKEQKVDQNIDQNKSTKNKKDEDLHQEDKKINVEEQMVDQNIDQNKSSSKADESNSEYEENDTQNKIMEERKHNYEKTTNRSLTKSTNKVSKKGSRSKRKPKSTKSIVTSNTMEEKPQENKKEDSKVEEMQQEIDQLREEAAKYQAALGGIRNVGWRDNELNNSMQLTKDIEKLQKDLADFTRVKRGGIVLNNDAVCALLQNHKCRTQFDGKNGKSVLGAVLQQHFIKFILESANSYFEEALSNIANFQENDFISGIIDDKLEAVILSRIKELIELTTRFEVTRIGTDEYSRILPTKLRQQVYAVLGHRGFSMSDHPFITQLTKDLINEMNKYRTIESEDKNVKLEKEIINIIIQVLRIFYFRLHTQEPIPSLEFYKSGNYFDPNVMELTSRIEQSDEEELEVEVCSFPAVALIKNIDEETKRVFTKAQVIVRPKK